jgi:hypothetical protein
LVAAPASAQTPEAAVLAPFEECAALSDASERLACYDRAIGRAKAIAEVNVAEREKARQDNFGLKATKQNEAETEKIQEGSGRLSAGDTEINAAIANAYSDSRTGLRLFLLDNGQIWQETDKGTLRRTPAAGSMVQIRRTRFGGYQIRVKDRSGFTNVKRLK